MAAKRRINITIDEATLRLADRQARRQKTSRREVFRAGVRALATNHERESEEEARRKRQREAAATMDRLAHEFGSWPAQKKLRASRERWFCPEG